MVKLGSPFQVQLTLHAQGTSSAQAWHPRMPFSPFLVSFSSPSPSWSNRCFPANSLSQLDLADWLRKQHALAPQAELSDAQLPESALALAKLLQNRALELQTPQERRQQAELDRMIQHPQDKATLTQMTDQSFRSNSPGRVVNQ